MPTKKLTNDEKTKNQVAVKLKLSLNITDEASFLGAQGYALELSKRQVGDISATHQALKAKAQLSGGSDRGAILYALSYHSVNSLMNIATLPLGNLDLIPICMRKLIEFNLLSKYLEHFGGYDEFRNSLAYERLQAYENFGRVGLKSGDPTVLAQAGETQLAFDKYRDEIKILIGNIERSEIVYANIAGQLGMQDDYDTWYRLASKYVHPSMYFFAVMEECMSYQRIGYFVEAACAYASDTHSRNLPVLRQLGV